MNGLTQFEKVLGIATEKQVNHRHQSINTDRESLGEIKYWHDFNT
jgi:hypothetical protein